MKYNTLTYGDFDVFRIFFKIGTFHRLSCIVQVSGVGTGVSRLQVIIELEEQSMLSPL